MLKNEMQNKIMSVKLFKNAVISSLNILNMLLFLGRFRKELRCLRLAQNHYFSCLCCFENERSMRWKAFSGVSWKQVPGLHCRPWQPLLAEWTQAIQAVPYFVHPQWETALVPQCPPELVIIWNSLRASPGGQPNAKYFATHFAVCEAAPKYCI